MPPQQPPNHTTHYNVVVMTISQRIGSFVRWLIAVLACMWIAWCTALGPLMRAGEGLRQFTWVNALIFVAMFAVCLGAVILLTKTAKIHPLRRLRLTLPRWTLPVRRFITRVTNSFPKLFLIFLIGWLWVPATLLTAYGADILSQTREFAWAWNQWTGLEQPYIGFFSFVPMDIYPTAHYLWPDNPTYLTDQHNIVLTVFYGGTAALSRALTGSNDAGFVFLSILQWLFAAFCCASAANRFFNMPWKCYDFTHPEQGSPVVLRDYTRPAAGHRARSPRGAGVRLAILLFFFLCPMAVFSTISLTKSPLFAFTFTWWFGLMYEVYMTRGLKTRRKTIAGLIVSCVVMLISAKYAWYILVAQVILSLLADRRRWKLYCCTLLLPTVLVHGAISLLISSGAIIGGDPIESRGAQLQMIARVASENPDAIPESARNDLSHIFHLDQTAQAYKSQDADPVKSSGIQSKKVSYRWRSVTEEDMERFNKAWLEIVRADPVTSLDALFAKSYGYFDIFDPPYVAADYYINNNYVQDENTWIKYYNHNWRNNIVYFAQGWSRIPVLGWVTHGNFYVVCTLLIGAAELVLRRWRALSWHMPLLLLMGVMITAPANNFERHMLPIAFVFGFLCLMFYRDSLKEQCSNARPV